MPRTRMAAAAFSLLMLVLCLPTQGLSARTNLPDLTELAETAGKAVVNISTTKMVDPREQFEQFFKRHPGGPGPFGDFFDQFERFFGERDSRPQEQRSLGSGFIISADGYIVTNNHVIAEADEIEVILLNDETPHQARIVGRDPDTDLALLKIDAGRRLPVLTFADSDATRVGEWVLAIGNPFGLDHSVTAGIISAKGRIIGAGPFDNFIQTDASINPGNSGGPLVNLEGEVIAINTAIIATGQGIGFAVPSNLAKGVIKQLKEHQKVKRGWLGITIQDLDENSAKALGLDAPEGALVSSVVPGDPADRAGIRTSDVIIAVNGRSVADANELLRAVAGLAPGEKVDLTIWREGRKRTIKATLGERGTESIAAKESRPAAPQSGEGGIGLSVRPPTADEARAFELEEPRGLLVIDVAAGSPAEESGLKPGDLILEINQSSVNTIRECRDALEQARKTSKYAMFLINRQGQNLFRTVPLP